MKLLAVTLAAATLLGASAASSQTLQIGPGGPSVDFRSQEQRDRDDWRERNRARAYRDDVRETGSLRDRRDCREVIIRERDEFGNRETRRELRCRR
jgi:hypothetical protein